MGVTLDSNVLVYASEQHDPRASAARTILRLAAAGGARLTVQALGEYCFVVMRKRVAPPEAAMANLRRLLVLFPEPLSHDPACVPIAAEAFAAGRFGFWDAMLLATAGLGGCTAIISEDMAAGSTLAGVRVVPAFAGVEVSPDALGVLAAGAAARRQGGV